jgi:hypothetical protein
MMLEQCLEAYESEHGVKLPASFKISDEVLTEMAVSLERDYTQRIFEEQPDGSFYYVGMIDDYGGPVERKIEDALREQKRLTTDENYQLYLQLKTHGIPVTFRNDATRISYNGFEIQIVASGDQIQLFSNQPYSLLSPLPTFIPSSGSMERMAQVILKELPALYETLDNLGR